MLRTSMLAACLLAPSLALANGPAVVSLDILSPTAGACVNNGGETFLGGILGGEAAQPQRPVSTRIRLSENNGNGVPDPIALTFLVDGNQQFVAVYTPAAEGVAEETDLYSLLAIQDGAVRTLTVQGQVANETAASDVVSFRLDRAAPTMRPVGDLPNGNVCNMVPPPLNYNLTDAQDPAPSLELRTVTNGCSVRRIYTVADNCGNAQEVVLTTRQFPADPTVVIAIDGVSEGDAVPSANPTYSLTAGQDCLDYRNATLRRGNEPEVVFIPGSLVDEPGDYTLSVTTAVCGGAQISATRRFTILQRPEAVLVAPAQVAQGGSVVLDARGSNAPAQIGGIVRYEWDTNGDGFFDDREGTQSTTTFEANRGDGVFTIRLRVTAGNGATAEASAVIRVTDVNPTCFLTTDAAEVDQGQTITFDAGGTVAGHPSDPIIAFDWYFENLPGPGVEPDQSIFGQDFALYVFDAPGPYRVTLVARDLDSICSASVDLVVRDVPPSISDLVVFDAARQVEGQPTAFAVTASPGGNDPIVSFAWDFGDGSPILEGPVERSPTHTYANNGTYTTRVTVTDVNGSTDEASVQVVVADLDPIVEVVGPVLGVEGQALVFSAGNTREGGPGDPLRALRWSFGDGTPVVNKRPDERDVTHVFERDGAVVVTLTAVDEDDERPATKNVTIFDVSPAADFAVLFPPGTNTGIEGEALRLDATTSTSGAPSDPITTYRWDLGNGVVREGPELATLDYAWPDNGTFLVRLTVEDEDGSEDSAEFTVEIVNAAPQLEIALPEGSLEIGVEQTFTARVVDVEDDVPTITWDMGDGTVLSGAVVRHTYDRIQRFRIRVSVDDGDGGTDEAEVNVDVTRALPRVNAENRYEGVEGEALTIDVVAFAAQQDDASFDGPVQVPAPALPEGARFTLTEPAGPEGRRTARIQWTPSFVDAGEFTVRLRVIAPSGLIRERSFTLSVEDAGTPFAVAASVVDGEGRLRVVEYGRDPNDRRLTFRPRDEVRLANGVGGLAADPSGRFVFAASPGSGGVAVIDLARPELSASYDRLIRTGLGCLDVAAGTTSNGTSRAWALNADSDSLTVIDAERLKALRTVPLGAMGRATGLAYLPAGDFGLAGDRLVVVTQGGEVRVIDVAAAERGQPALRAQRRIGGVLTHVVADPSSDRVFVADAKARRVLAFDAGDFEADAAAALVSGAPLDFPALGLAATGNGVWAATSVGVAAWSGDAGDSATVDGDVTGSAIAPVPTDVYPTGGLLVSSGNALRHVDESLSELLFANARRSRTLLAFVSRR